MYKKGFSTSADRATVFLQIWITAGTLVYVFLTFSGFLLWSIHAVQAEFFKNMLLTGTHVDVLH